jgi:hypothetical protein
MQVALRSVEEYLVRIDRDRLAPGQFYLNVAHPAGVVI